jgi:hypothetical protein
MWQRLIVGFLLAIAAFFVVRYFSTPSSDSFMNWSSNVGTYAQAPVIQEPIPLGPMVVASGGPNSPNAAPPSSMPSTLSPPPEASSPFDETAESADAPESLRNPERSFGPGIIPEQTAIASASGIAGPVAESAQAFQHFGPELVTSGGNFFGSVSALEDENPNYSAF